MKILITGATSGLGKALANTLSADHDLILVGRDEEKLERLAGLVYQRNRHQTYAVELDDNLQTFKFASWLREQEQLPQVVINSAADFGPTSTICNVSGDAVMHAFAVNVFAPFLITQAVLPAMITSGFGRIINIGSTAGLKGYSLRTPYCLSKTALVGLTKTINAEIDGGFYGPDKDIRSFCVCPGPFTGERLDKQIKVRADVQQITYEESEKKFTRIYGRILKPNEVVTKIISLLQPKSALEGEHEIVLFK